VYPVSAGRSPRRAVEALGEFDDQAFGSADVAEEERVLEVDDLRDRFPAGRSDAVDDATHVVDLEGDVPEPRTVRGRRQLWTKLVTPGRWLFIEVNDSPL
jgi:hypothetical protein